MGRGDSGLIREAAARYVALGWYPIPLKHGTKECRDSDWRTRIYDADDFSPEDNLGIRLVKATDERKVKLVSVDLDAQECAGIAEMFLPRTGASWGRDSKLLSQCLYVSPFEKAVTYKDAINGSTIVEIRVDHQSMAPPSVHPCGEALRWLTEELDAPEIDPKILLRAARLLATAVLTGRYYNPPGSRHDWCLALAGTLRQFDLTEDETSLVITAGARISGDQHDRDRRVEVHSTYSRADDDIVTGAPRLAELMEDRGAGFVASLRRIWGERSPFVTDAKGKQILANNQSNIRRAMEEMSVSLSTNTFSQRMMIKRGGESLDDLNDRAADRLWLEIESKYHFRPSRDYFDTVVRDTAGKFPFHPVRDYFATLKWDGVPRINEWLIEYGGAAKTDYSRAVGPIVLIAAVRRVTQPGCKFDELMVFESAQGKNKSTALRCLCPNEEWFSDDLPLGVETKQVIERTAGKWIIEAAELINMRRAQVEQLKAFLSRQVDGPVRMAYGRMPTQVYRQFVIFGTTNSTSYLRDPSGNRRFWPVQVGIFNIKNILRDRDQLWAEAVHREAGGESIRLAQAMWGVAEKEQEKRRTEDPWEEKIAQVINRYASTGLKIRIDPEELWDALGLGVDRREERGAERITAIMQRRGFTKMVVKDKETGKRSIRGWGKDPIDGVFTGE